MSWNFIPDENRSINRISNGDPMKKFGDELRMDKDLGERVEEV